ANDWLPQKSAAAALTVALSFPAGRDLIEYADDPENLAPAVKRSLIAVLAHGVVLAIALAFFCARQPARSHIAVRRQTRSDHARAANLSVRAGSPANSRLHAEIAHPQLAPSVQLGRRALPGYPPALEDQVAVGQRQQLLDV